jgi:hypothetical protein
LRFPVRRSVGLVCACVASASLLAADEGMWTFDNPPAERLQRVYGFAPTREWLDKVRLASVRFNDDGSGSFVSPAGLMITNHHIGLGCVQNLSTRERDYVSEGFLASSRDQEPACPGYEVNVLISTQDVSARVLGAVKPAMSDNDAGEARRAASAEIEQECSKRTGERCDVITLYQGGEFHLYTYKKYTDVRLVFAPEQQIAFFGGDADNFSYPRHALDVCFFRAYENGKPVTPAAYLPWSTTGVEADELVFVSGNPGSTSRLKTMASLEATRDGLPWTLQFIKRRLAALAAFSSQGAENARRAKTQTFGLDNAYKALSGQLRALQNEKAMAGRAAEEAELKKRVHADAALANIAGDAWDVIAAAETKAGPRYAEMRLVGFGGSRLLGFAGTIVRYAVEIAKPNAVRLEEFRDSNLASLENRLYSEAPVHGDLEEATLADQLALALEELGAKSPFVVAALDGKTPAQAAKEAVAGSSLADVATRRALVKGGAAAVEASKDTMIRLARRIDPIAREARRFLEDEVEAVRERAGERIAQVRFKVHGKTLPPDATFTLRLSYGAVKAYPAEGTDVAPFTTFHGLYDRWASRKGQAPWNLPGRYLERKGMLELTTPLNFVSTADTTGGNSGSPTIDKEGAFVGISFDGNIQSLALDYFYTDEQARSISVDSRGILEALGKLYDARELVGELTRR